MLPACERTNSLADCFPVAGLGPRLAPLAPFTLFRDLLRIAYTKAGVSFRLAAFAFATTSTAGMSFGRLRMKALLFGVFFAAVLGILLVPSSVVVVSTPWRLGLDQREIGPLLRLFVLSSRTNHECGGSRNSRYVLQ